MTNRRAKLAAAGTVVGLAALGGVALGTNPGPQGLVAQAPGVSHGAVVTAASGASAATLPTAAEATERAPIVTRSSGAPSAAIDD